MVAINTEVMCGECCFYLENKDNHGDTGICRRYPPTVFMVPIQGVVGSQPKIGFQSCYPPTQRHGGCGEFHSCVTEQPAEEKGNE
jgi:hypothetical protein